ncbi:hypothetical protein TrST_g2276 [Triparma strigata]|uniref:Uncharacterized protein n=1 Tax=Triparma strigata TaxID=1606541 RepID=A0A9W7AR61_9STRA|nr:hypothetical protein TrST_g2276 [Triparma strigata]
MPPPNPPKRRKSWCKVQEMVLGGNFPFDAADPSHASSPNEISPRAFLPTGKRRGSKGNAMEVGAGGAISPLDLKPVAPLPSSHLVPDSPSPRASRNQKQKVPELKFGKASPKINPSEKKPFEHLEYQKKNFIPNKSLGMSVSIDGDIFIKKSVAQAWAVGGESDSNETDREIQVDKITATRISEEFERTVGRKERENDIYYQYYCKETAAKIEDNRDKVERSWLKESRSVKRMTNSNSCFLSLGGEEGGEGEGEGADSDKVTEEVERMRKRLLRNVNRDDCRVVSESDFSDNDYMDTGGAGGAGGSGGDMEIDIPTDSDSETMREASARRNKDLTGLISELKVKGGEGVGIGSLLTRSIEVGLMSGGNEIGFSMRSSFEK